MAISDRFKKFNVEDIIIEEEESFTPELYGLCDELTKALSKKIASIPIWFDYSKQEQQDLISSFLNNQLNEKFNEIKLTTKEIERISNKFFDSVYGFGSLDFLIAQKDVTQIFVNSPIDILIERKGNIEKSDVIMDDKQFLSLIKWLINLSKKNAPIITFRFHNFLITIIQEPVCRTKLIIKKISDVLFNFEYFSFKNILDADVISFLRYLIDNQKRLLVSAPSQCGKTSFINALINELDNDVRITLFEEGGLINTNKIKLNRYDIECLTDKEQKNLITAALSYKPEYVFSDTNNVGFNIEISDILEKTSGFVSTIRANSPTEALSFYTSVMVSRLKCTEKLAKTEFVKDFDYIIQLDKADELFLLRSIYEVGKNKNGTTVLTEVVNNESGRMNYKFVKEVKTEEVPQIVEEPELPKDISFSSRFGL